MLAEKLARKLARGALALAATLLAGAVLFGDLPLIGAIKLFVFVLAVGAYIRWIVYAASVRPKIAQKLGGRFGVSIHSGGSTGLGTAGMWEIAGEAPLWFRVALPFIDLCVMLCLFFLPFALGLPLVLFVLNGFSF